MCMGCMSNSKNREQQPVWKIAVVDTRAAAPARSLLRHAIPQSSVLERVSILLVSLVYLSMMMMDL